MVIARTCKVGLNVALGNEIMFILTCPLVHNGSDCGNRGLELSVVPTCHKTNLKLRSFPHFKFQDFKN